MVKRLRQLPAIFLGLILLSLLLATTQARQRSADASLAKFAEAQIKGRFAKMNELIPPGSHCCWWHWDKSIPLAKRETWVSRVNGRIYPSICLNGEDAVLAECDYIITLEQSSYALSRYLVERGLNFDIVYAGPELTLARRIKAL